MFQKIERQNARVNMIELKRGNRHTTNIFKCFSIPTSIVDFKK